MTREQCAIKKALAPFVVGSPVEIKTDKRLARIFNRFIRRVERAHRLTGRSRQRFP